MVFASRSLIDCDTMAQIVPSAGFSPPSSYDYGGDFTAENFDLSLLSNGMDCEVPFSSTNSNLQHLLSLYYETNSPPPMFPTEYPNQHKPMNFDVVKESSCCSFEEPAASIKMESAISFSETCADLWAFEMNSKFMNNHCTPSIEQIKDDNIMLSSIPILCEQNNKSILPSNQIMDFEDDWRFRTVISPQSLSCSSSCSSPELQPSCINQKNTIGRYSPLDDLKQEITIDLENLLSDPKFSMSESPKKESILLRSMLEKDFTKDEIADTFDQGKKSSSTSNNDHKLLREALRDTSFQKKYNLRPFDIDGLGTAFETEIKSEKNKLLIKSNSELLSSENKDECNINIAEENMEPILSQAIEQLMQDVDNTCVMLGISKDPTLWSVEDVRAWLLWNARQYNLPVPMELFNITGADLIVLTEQDFQQKSPQCAGILYAQLEIWKAAGIEDIHQAEVKTPICDTTPMSNKSNTDNISDDDDDIDDDEMIVSPQTTQSSPQTTMKSPVRGNGSHIHLWQFLKELLQSPQSNGSCIRWIDRSKGVFKIEDSVRVARLWGKRKNRPAMNYDKLSRSIRQYYKKGIMKKTERSQRLVYQFCAPYNL